MYHHINEITGLPIIGQKYRVPCITSCSPKAGRMENVPVIGTIHEDKYYFDVEWYHIHFDLRFIEGLVRKWIFDDIPSSEGESDDLMFGYAVHKDDIVEHYERVLPCVRQMPIFRFERCYNMVVPLQDLLPAGKRKLSKCGKCPHRGTPLNGMQVNRNGIVVCPAHGLAFNTKTREMVLRSKENTLDEL